MASSSEKKRHGKSPQRRSEAKGRRTARSLALDVLLRVEGGAYAAAALDGELNRAAFDSADRALSTELVYGVLRWRGALDHHLSQVTTRPLGKLDPVVLGCLRLGAYQLLGDLRVPSYAAVSEMVNLIRGRRGKGAAGLVNAVLRKLSSPSGEARKLDPAHTLPQWLGDKFKAEYGVEALDLLARHSVEQPWTGLRLEPHRSSGRTRSDLMEELLRQIPGATVEEGRWSPLALRAKGLGPLSRLEPYKDGWMSVQDEGAQLSTLLLDIAPGHRILDACAGRGGKTTLLASLAGGRATLDAADRHPRKLERLKAELERLRLSGVRTVAVDLEQGVGDLSPPYDRILVDVPCSGTGTLARRPEIRWRLEPHDIERLVESQRRILERCLSMLRPGGVLVYCACSLLPDEGRAQLEVAGKSRKLRVVRELVLLPHIYGTDGFYAARVVVEGE